MTGPTLRNRSPYCASATDGDLTVRVLGTQEPDLDTVVDATDEVWEELS